MSETFYERLQLAPEDILGQPLAGIVDPRDVYILRTAVSGVLNQLGGAAAGGGGAGSSGTLVDLRVACGGISCEASMTITVGSEGLIVVTRLY